MGKTLKFWCITYILATLTIVNGVRIQTNRHHPSAPSNPSAPAPTGDCSQIIYDMEDCLSFLIDGESDPKPSPTCCSGLAKVLKIDGCVCEGLKGAANMGISINLTKAATLPGLCHLSAPPLSSCFSNAPVPSPGPSPAPPTTNPPTTTPPTTNPPSSSPTPATPTNPPATPPPTRNPPSSSPTPTNPPASSPPSTPDTPPASSPPPTSGTTPSAPTTSPSSNAPEANSPSSDIHSPPSKSAGTSTMPVFLISSVMVVVAPFLV